MTNSALKMGVVVDPIYGENCYIAFREGRSDCLVVDPSFDTDSILKFLEENNLQPAAILNTHGHADHIAGNNAIKEAFPDCPLMIGAGDAEKLTDAVANLSRPFGMDLLSPAADRLLNEGETLNLAGIELEVFDTPGHSSGHIIFLFKEMSPWIVFGGDVLFQGSIGRTDFPGCSFEVLAKSIHSKLYNLPDDTLVLPGHGPSTTVGEEKQNNAFVRGK